MIFCFSGTGNSRYIAQRVAEALQETVIDLNARIKANDTTTVDTGSDVIMVTPTYAWRIPKIVSEWMAKTKWTGAKRIWFVMDCGSEIGNAAKYNRSLAEQKRTGQKNRGTRRYGRAWRRGKTASLYGNSTDYYAGELYRHVQCTSGG